MAPDATYDAFLSHANPDKPAVEELARRLKAEGLKPFLDKWHLVPGEPWQEAIEIAMDRSRACVVFVGPGPLGPWQIEEMRNALDLRVCDNSRRVIPVLLPGASLSVLPPFLARLTWVDFRSGFNDPQAFQRLVCGIKGKEPEDGQAGSLTGRASWQSPKGKTPRAKDLRQLWFEWPESLYGRFNFQRDEHIDALTERLLGTDRPAVVILGGEPGIGRSFLCDAAARRAHDQGHRVAVWHLDLDGFEPDVQNPLTQYLRHLIDQEERHPDAARGKTKGSMKSSLKTISRLDLLGPASEVAASLLSLLWQFEDPLRCFAAILDQPPRSTGTRLRDDPETLHHFLSELTQNRKLLVHVSDGPQLTSHLRRRLIREAERAREHLLLVISCPLVQTTTRAAPEARLEPDRFDLQPLDSDELCDLLDRRFNPNEFSDDFVALIMRRCHGWPVAVANLLADLMEAEVLISEGETWRLPPAGLKDPRLVQAFSLGLFEEVDSRLAILTEEEQELADNARELLSLAALCGRFIPLAALLEYLGLKETAAEATVDWVDDVLVGEVGWLTDLGFHVTGFNGHNVYAFTHPLLPQVILDQESEGERTLRAAGLLRFLEKRAQVTRKGWARCFLSIAEHLGERERETYQRSLAWWVGLETAAALQAEVRAAIESAEIEPDLALRVAEDSASWNWPAYRRLAVINALAQVMADPGSAEASILPFGRIIDFHLLRATLYIDVGRYPEALSDSMYALTMVSRDPMKRAVALNLSGLARYYLSDFNAAKADLKTAWEICQNNSGHEHELALSVESNLAETLKSSGDLVGAALLELHILKVRVHTLGEEHRTTLGVRNNLAESLRVLGDLPRAMSLHEQNLEIFERSLGKEHPETLHARNNLALTLQELGELSRAKLLQEQNLEIRERVLGGEHPHTLTARISLAETLRLLGDLDATRKLQEQNLITLERVLGREHSTTLTQRENLAGTLKALHEPGSARALQEQNLEVRERTLGDKHPQTTLSAWNLLMAIRDLNDPDAEAQVIAKLRWLLDRDEDSVPSANQRKIRRMLFDLLKESS